MNGSAGTSILVYRLLAESPLLLAAVAGIVLGAVMLRRAARICCIHSCATLLVGTLIVAFIQSALFESRMTSGISNERFATYSNLLGYGTGVMRGVAFGLVVTAAVVGRGRSRA